jgi:hypothetical protein
VSVRIAGTRPAGAVTTVEADETDRFGWLPAAALTASIGLLVVAFAYTAARQGQAVGGLLFWVGVLAIIVPVAIRLLGHGARRFERVGLVVLLGMALYGVKLLHDPTSFTFFDEFHHWATVEDIVRTGRLFERNNILPTSPYYPGLEILAAALMSFGLPLFEAGVLVVGVARLLFCVALFLFYERAGASVRVASIATMIYMANPGFVFFDAQFAYESLALPIAALVLFVVARRDRAPGRSGVALTTVILIGIAAVTVTHHITALALAAFLALWSIVAALLDRMGHRTGTGPAGPALMAITASVAWMLYVSVVTVGYLAPAFEGAMSEVVRLMTGDSAGRELFRAAGSQVPPAWEPVASYLSVAILLVALSIGLFAIRRHHRFEVLYVTLGVGALAYPASLASRLTERGAEIAARTSEFIFVALGFVTALAIVALGAAWRRRRGRMPTFLDRRPTPLLAAGVIAIFVGGVILALPAWARLPGPYLVAADPRSVEPEGISAAAWMRRTLGTENRVMTDRTNRALLATYGDQHPISAVGDQVNVKAAYFSTLLERDQLEILRRAGVRYVLADLRLATALPTVGVYVERGELLSGPHLRPMDLQALTKYDDEPLASRVFDSGSIRIYDIGELIDALE